MKAGIKWVETAGPWGHNVKYVPGTHAHIIGVSIGGPGTSRAGTMLDCSDYGRTPDVARATLMITPVQEAIGELLNRLMPACRITTQRLDGRWLSNIGIGVAGGRPSGTQRPRRE
jgi:hypothetical protein